MNTRQKQVYGALTQRPPVGDQHGWGSAYWLGFRNPALSVDRAGPIVGAPGSEARAAYRAGQDAAKRKVTAGSPSRVAANASKRSGRVSAAYWTEKVEAYNVAIEALRMHEPASDCDLKLAAQLRERLARKLDREIQRWVDANPLPEGRGIDKHGGGKR